jgi:hypothetical protein
MSVCHRFLHGTAFPGSVLWKPKDMCEGAAGVKNPDVVSKHHPTPHSSTTQNEWNQNVIIMVSPMRPLMPAVVADNTNRRMFQPAGILPGIENTRNAAIGSRDGIHVWL